MRLWQSGVGFGDKKKLVNEVRDMTANNSAILSNESKYTVFSYGDTVIRFRTPDILERYEKVLEWDKANGYSISLEY